MKLLDKFTYTVILHKIKELKTLKSKEELIRAVSSSLSNYYKLENITETIFSYKAYCYLLVKCYPNYTKKLPKFITETKDCIGTQLLEDFIEKEKIGENITNQLLNTFEYTDTLYYDIYEESDFFYLNKALKSNKFLATLVLNFKKFNYVPFSTNIIQLPIKNLTKFAKSLFIIKNNGTMETAYVDSYHTNTYTISERSTEIQLDMHSLNTYFYLLTYNTLPGNKSQYFYWETLAKELYKTLGPKYLNLMEQATESMTRSIRRSKQIYQLKENK